MLLPLPLSPTSATISRSRMVDVEVVDGMQDLLREHPAETEVARQVDRAQQRLLSWPRRRVACSTLTPPPSPARRTAGSARRASPTGTARVRRSGTAGMTSGQRGWKRQPLGGRARSGGLPGIPISSRRGPGPTGTRSSGRGCRDGGAARRSPRSGRSPTTWPAYITSTRSRVAAHDRHVVGHEDDGEAELALEVLDLGHQRSLGHDVERRGRLVHDHELQE